jgi:hypothetical protein
LKKVLSNQVMHFGASHVLAEKNQRPVKDWLGVADVSHCKYLQHFIGL